MNNDCLPAVCICIPTYNSASTIRKTLDSILRQQYRNISIIIMDNASTDGTIDIVMEYERSDLRVQVIACEKNIGAEGNFTRCLQIGRGKYTAIFHADDIYHSDIVEKQVAFLEKYSSAGAVFTLATNIDERENVIGNRLIPDELMNNDVDLYDFSTVFKLTLKHGNFLICSSAMVRTEIYTSEIGIWDGDKYSTSADLDVWFRILEKHKIGILKEKLMEYRMSRHGFSYSYARKTRGKHDVFLVFDAYLQGKAKKIIDDNDVDNYNMLLLKDNINRAIVHLLQRNPCEVRRLLNDIFSLYYLRRAKCMEQRKILFIGYVTYILSFLSLNNYIIKLLSYIRYNKSWR